MSYTSNEYTSGLRLLIVEDDHINRFVLEKILSAANWNYTFARSGEEALVILGNSSFDFVLLDIELPGLNGYQTAKAIQKMAVEGINSPYILAMTGHQYTDEAEKIEDCGISGWIVKPLSLQLLQSIIQDTIERSSKKTQDVINLDLLTEIAGDDPGFIRVCIELFLGEMPENLNRLNSAIQNSDWETIRTISHKMKTSLNYMGMSEHRSAAASIEKLSREKREIECIKTNALLITKGCHKAFKELHKLINNSELTKP